MIILGIMGSYIWKSRTTPSSYHHRWQTQQRISDICAKCSKIYWQYFYLECQVALPAWNFTNTPVQWLNVKFA